jgi:hypothetical protein
MLEFGAGAADELAHDLGQFGEGRAPSEPLKPLVAVPTTAGRKW